MYGDHARGKFLYVCSRYPNCDRYVGIHKKSRLPLGTLAGADVRRKWIEAHRAFNRLWESGLMKKSQAYKWLQAKLGLNAGQTHIGQFSAYMCDQVIAACEQAQANIREAV